MNKNTWMQGGIIALLLLVGSTFILLRHHMVHAQTPSAELTVANEEDIPTPTQAELIGPAVNLIFSVPGIASQGGNIKPLHPKRTVEILVFKSDVNAGDSSIEPLYTALGEVTFDTNPSSPTYGKFINPRLDLGEKVEDGQYQIVFKMDQALQKLVTEKDTDIGGVPIYLSKGSPIDMPPQTVILGDIMPAPHGNNVIDIADYNAFMSCYGDRISSSSCTAKQGADFDDNGVIDGIDYNLMLLNFQSLLALGLPVPTLEPSVPPKKAISPTKLPPPPTKKAAAQTTQGGSPIGIILFMLLLIPIIVCAVLYFINPKFKAAIQKILKRSATKQPEAIPPDQAATATLDATAAPGPAEEKSYYVKKQSDDDAKTGVWLDLTDDNGKTLAHYAGTDVVDGFAKVTGEMKTENGKTFLEISQITPEA